jgi:hypothetical protein
MSMIFSETELSSASLRKLLAAPQIGRRYVLLDSVRDSGFLSSTTIVNPVSPVNDGGLGITDNGIFFYTSKYVPGNPTTPRQYPVKFLWIGSPAGTNDTNDQFSIYVADVNQDAFYPGAVASVWLVNPRLVLHYSQAGTDIINWFDSNYPGGATNGVGNTNTGSNSTYGTLAGDSSAVGNISKMLPGNSSASIDGQFWPIYDNVDGSALLYFSIKTPNENTLSIYCYKSSVSDPSNGAEFASPLTSSQFLGGVVSNFRSIKVTSSYRFSLLSPDPLVTLGKSPGQSAVGFYSFGAFDGQTSDHGRWLVGFNLLDIHNSPLNWVSPGATSAIGALDGFGFFNVDKLGSIQAVSNGTNNVESCYAVVYNATSDRDIRKGSNAVVISAMQIRVAYYHPGAAALAFGAEPLIPPESLNDVGHCRPQYTNFPDGLPKIISAAFTFDQYLNIGYNYVQHGTIEPERQKALSQSYDQMPEILVIPTFGKKRMRYVGKLYPYHTYPSPNPRNIPLAAQLEERNGLDTSTGSIIYSDFADAGTLLLTSQDSGEGTSGLNTGLKTIDIELDGILSPYITLLPPKGGPITVFGVVELRD